LRFCFYVLLQNNNYSVFHSVFAIKKSRPQANDRTCDAFAGVAIYKTRSVVAMAAVVFVRVDNKAAAQDIRAVAAKSNHGVSKRAFDAAVLVGFQIS
jgi:hypothetical protein